MLFKGADAAEIIGPLRVLRHPPLAGPRSQGVEVQEGGGDVLEARGQLQRVESTRHVVDVESQGLSERRERRRRRVE